ncbi:conserved hypothetical protein [Carnobacterium maltaromaticum]|nr:conserved hypothetical protein [Carnobacterium maltaromaticum]
MQLFYNLSKCFFYESNTLLYTLNAFQYTDISTLTFKECQNGYIKISKRN